MPDVPVALELDDFAELAELPPDELLELPPEEPELAGAPKSVDKILGFAAGALAVVVAGFAVVAAGVAATAGVAGFAGVAGVAAAGAGFGGTCFMMIIFCTGGFAGGVAGAAAGAGVVVAA
jgi:hypothetical protein